MKNLGISGRLLLITLLAGVWTWTNGSPSRAHSPQPTGAAGPDNRERGDVPGWVMITLMSAVLVAALLALAGPALETMFNQAMDRVGR
ncbi:MULTISPECIES: hypothetical protein [unclassified Arthrobacter]|uniref:hypothetical protein n=1 Tax=unclassified Arthrobacter TaxID=235627 RepID=UPI00339727A1